MDEEPDGEPTLDALVAEYEAAMTARAGARHAYEAVAPAGRAAVVAALRSAERRYRVARPLNGRRPRR